MSSSATTWLAYLTAAYKASATVGHLEGLEAVYLAGRYAALGGTPPANVQGVVPSLPMPTTIASFMSSDVQQQADAIAALARPNAPPVGTPGWYTFP